MSSTVEAETAIEHLRASSRALHQLEPLIEAGRPWPTHVVEHDAGPESEWGPMEVLAHVAEMLPYWLGEVARISDGAPQPVPFGRTVDDRLRVLTIERDRSLPPDELLERIDSTVERYARLLRGPGGIDLDRRGLHPRLGEMTIAAILERFVVHHAEEHLDQLAAALDSNPQLQT